MRFGYDAKRAFHNSSGLGNYSRDIIRILSNQFPDQYYILYNPKPSNLDWIKESDNVHIHYPKSKFWKIFSSLWRQRAISNQIKKDKIDLYHGLSGEIPGGIDRSKTKIAVTIHDLIFMRFPELYKPVDRKIYFNKVNFAVQNSDVIIAISKQTKNDIIHFLKVDENKVKVHYQGCHPAFKKEYSLAEKNTLRKRYNLPEKFILNVGTLEKRKNILFLLQAIKDLSYHLVLVGKHTKYVNELEAFIGENQMQQRIHFVQGLQMKELAALYQAATLFCYPSLFEGFGIPIIESLFSRTAVITSTGSCFEEAGGPDSVYVKAGDFNDLKNEISDLMENEIRRHQIEESGYAFVQKFNDENVGNGMMEIYQNLL
jgi:glycosyltransferase involved in cell wall biosynthesis